MSQQIDPRIANVVYNFLGNTLAQLNEIDKNNLGSSSLKAVKTNPKNVFSMSHDASMNLLPNEMPVLPSAPPIQQPETQLIPQATVVNAGLNIPNTIPVATLPVTPPQTRIELGIKNSGDVKKEIENIISALSNIKNLLNEPIHD